MDPFQIVKDSSIWNHSDSFSAFNKTDGLIRIGTIQKIYNDGRTGELRYLVEADSHGDKIPIECVMLRRFGGVFNYEDYILHGYSINDKPDPVDSSAAKAGDRVLVGQLNGQGREGVILGGLTHTARKTTIQASNGPQYDAEFNGVHTNINKDGEWTLTFKGQPTNLSTLSNIPSGIIPSPTYDATVGSSFMKFDKTGSWKISDNATSDPQFIFIDKPNGTVSTVVGKISLVMKKVDESVVLKCKALTINSTDSIKENTKDYALKASSTAKFDSPKIAIGTGGIELLQQITDQLQKIITWANSTGAIHTHMGNLGYPTLVPDQASKYTQLGSELEAIKGKIDSIKGSL